ncbi:MAG: arsenic resistance protein [Pseudoalteromonas distincta]|jgi:arsenite transporter
MPARISLAALEANQLRLYLLAVALGLIIGTYAAGFASLLDSLLWPVLALLLYATFVQVPVLHLKQALADRRFMAALLLGNFLLLPLLAWGLMQALPDDPALRLGVLLVLLVPCTDWFITFCHLGGGSPGRAVAVTPLNLLLQFLLLPFYLWLMLPQSSVAQLTLEGGDLLAAAVGLLAVPLVLAAVTQRWIEHRPARAAVQQRLAWLPVPMLALVLMIICATNSQIMQQAGPVLLAVVPVFVLFLLAAGLLARGLTQAFQLSMPAGRTLAFSFGTRNSFVVLPLALALPAGWEMAVVVVVIQSLVELAGMLFYLWWIPRKLFR